jgi:hypothetical protein
MAIFNLPGRPSIGEMLGTGLGSGIQSGAQLGTQLGLQNLMGQLQKQQQSQQNITGLAALGYTPEQAQQLSGLPQPILSEIVKQKVKEPQQQAFAQALQQLSGQPGQLPGQEAGQQVAPSQLTGQQAAQLASLQQQQQKLEFEKEKAQQKAKVEAEKFQYQMDKDAEKRLEPFVKEIQTQGEEARAILPDLELQRTLLRNNKMDNPSYVKLAESMGLDFGAMLSGDTEAFRKSTINMAAKQVKPLMGARPTEFGFKQILKANPNILQSQEQKEQMTNRLFATRQLAEKTDRVFDEIVAKNKNRVPANIKDLLETQLKKDRDDTQLRYNYGLPPASEFEPGSIWQEYGIKFRVEPDGTWKQLAQEPKE